MRRALVLALALLAACSPEGDKPPIGDLPILHGKDDSWRTPWKGGSLLVGEQRYGSFDELRGWIAFDADLAAGLVDLDLADAYGEAGGLDTLLVVYGPMDADGSFPSEPLAVNDDVEPGANLASHIALDAPVDGRYRLVVSTYDNYAAWPANVSAGDYLVTIKCGRIEDEGRDACGLHLRGHGEACLDDAACGPDSTCEGEIACAPGTECLWVREGVCVGELAWVAIGGQQCGQDAWQQGSPSSEADDLATFEDADLDAMHAWLADLGVFATSMAKLDDPGDAVCLSCSCASGESYLAEVPVDEARWLVEQQGFRFALDEFRALAPVQCGGNPWQASDADPAEGEIEAVRAWADAIGVPLGLVGFAVETYAPFVCSACSCARGDLLVVTPAQGSDQRTVDELGFTTLYGH
jgi:hypothetical protein